MAYIVERGSRRFVGSGGVIVVHAALAYLLVFGLAVPEFIKPPEVRFTGVPVAPPTEPPPPQERKKEEPQAKTETTITNPPDPFDFTTDNNVTTEITNTILPPLGDTVIPTVGGTGGEAVEAVLFTPTLARPINDVLRWVTTNDYPRISIRREEQGVARFRVTIDARGNVTGCTITRSSGSAALDEATCKHVTKRARFEPATDKFGAKVPGTYSNSVNWKLPE